MIHGFFRLKDRMDRRPGFPVESRLTHLARRFREVRKTVWGWVKLILEMEELWLQTRHRGKAEQRIIFELKRAREDAHRGLRTADLQLALYRAKLHVPELRVPSRLSLALRGLNLKFAGRMTYSRADIQEFWNRTWKNWRCGRISRIRPHKVALNLVRDAELLALFALALLKAEPRSLATPKPSNHE
jgi:hypothetical protein